MGRKEKPARSRDFELLYGLHSVREALRQQKRKFQMLYLNKNHQGNSRLQEILVLAESLSVPVTEITAAQLEQNVLRSSHQGVVLSCTPLPELSWPAYEESSRDCLNAMAVLDQVEDPQNLGAIIRSCGFFRLKSLVISRNHSCSITPSVSKTSAGVAEWFPVITVTNLVRFLEGQKKEGYWVVGLDGKTGRELQSLKMDRPLILVLGSEGQGLRPLVRKTCDWLVRIDGNEYVDSLNVSNTAAIALHKLHTSSTTMIQTKGL